MNLRNALAVAGLLLTTGIAASAQSTAPIGPTNYTFDENGNGGIQNLSNPFQITSNKGSLVNGILTYGLPFAETPGDLWLYDSPSPAGSSVVISDVLRFTANNTVQFYSENTNGSDSLADQAGLPPPAYGNVISVPETGSPTSNGAIYTPTLGQPGYDPAAGPNGVSYFIVSDSNPVPEAASSASLGLLLALGLGGFIVARKRSRA